MLERFNKLLSSLSLDVATQTRKDKPPESVWVVHDANAMGGHEIQLLTRLIQQFPGAGISVILMFTEGTSQGDAIANHIFEFTGQILGEALANFVMFSSPQAIVLFGGLTKAGDLILNPTVQAMETNLIQIFKNKVKILYSDLKEADAAILGASALVWDA